MDTVFVIGNGFDIDLGLKSRYSDFAASTAWPFKLPSRDYSSPLAQFLNYHKEVDKWLDLEQLLGEYVVDAFARGGRSYDKDKADFMILKNSLAKYLTDLTHMPDIRHESAAAKLLSRINLIGNDMASFYSFNYTEPKSFMLDCTVKACHIHGELSKDNIILGFGDSVNDVGEYNTLRKSFSADYKPPRIIQDLLGCRKAVFFGLSMGDVDYAYFDYFFEAISKPENQNSDLLGKEILFFTHNESSRDDILRNLFLKTKQRLSNLRTLNSLSIVTTADTDPATISKIIDEI